jgi:hypothetical protein
LKENVKPRLWGVVSAAANLLLLLLFMKLLTIVLLPVALALALLPSGGNCVSRDAMKSAGVRLMSSGSDSDCGLSFSSSFFPRLVVLVDRGEVVNLVGLLVGWLVD